jgi:hypothetical protein
LVLTFNLPWGIFPTLYIYVAYSITKLLQVETTVHVRGKASAVHLTELSAL